MTTSQTPSIEFQPFRLPRMGLDASGRVTLVREDGRLELRSVLSKWYTPRAKLAVVATVIVPVLVAVVIVTPLWVGLPAILFVVIFGGVGGWAAENAQRQMFPDFVIELPLDPALPVVLTDGGEQMLRVTAACAQRVRSRTGSGVGVWWRLQLRCGEHLIHVIDRAGPLDRVAGALAHAWQLPVEVESIKVRDGGGAYDWSTAPYTTLKLERRLKSADGVVRYRPVEPADTRT